MTSAELDTCEVLGVSCVVGTVDSMADALIARALSGAGGYVVLCNVHVLMTARRDPSVMRTIEGAWAVVADGAPIAWLQRRAGMCSARRVAGPDLMWSVLNRGRDAGIRHAFFGSTPDVARALALTTRDQIPGVEIGKVCAPPPGTEDDELVITELHELNSHIVWCALGAPKQEAWMEKMATRLAPAIVVGVGAAFDFHSGRLTRAPRWMRESGLEWMHRLGREPRRLGRRYLLTNSRFLMALSVSIVRKNRRWRSL